MVIKNKDGTTYQLRRPNPIMVQQDIWTDFEIHNMQFQEETVTNTNKETIKNKKKINLGQTVVDDNKNQENREIISVQSTPAITEPPKTIIQEKPVAKDPEPEQKKIEDIEVERAPSVNASLSNYKKTIIHCLQSESKTHIDDLYGERSTKVKYIGKFTFEAILIDEDDFKLVFWTHLNKVTKYSVIYPQNKEKRWWKVNQVKQAPEGYFINCIPSEYHPNFD
jgi:hypothetical protein